MSMTLLEAARARTRPARRRRAAPATSAPCRQARGAQAFAQPDASRSSVRAPRSHVPVLAEELLEQLAPAARADGDRLHVRRRRARAPGRRAARLLGNARRDRPRPAGRAALRGARGRDRVHAALHPLGLRRGARAARAGGNAGGHRVLRPRHVLDAGRHARARLLLLLRGAARHAHGSRAAAERARRSSPSGTSAGSRTRCATSARSVTPDAIARAIVRRARAVADRDDARARRHDQLDDPRAGALRGRASGQALLPGAADRGQRRARTARSRAAARLGAAARGWRARRHLLPLARGPARQALPRRARPRLHLPAGDARLRLRSRAAGGAADAALDRAVGGRARAQPARRLGAPARRQQAERRAT